MLEAPREAAGRSGGRRPRADPSLSSHTPGRGGRLGIRASQCPVAISPGDATPIDSLAARLGTSAGQIMLACYLTQLWRLASAPVTVAAEFDGRRHPGLGEALGLLAGYLPLRCEAGALAPVPRRRRASRGRDPRAADRQDLFDWGRLVRRGERPRPARFQPFGFDFAVIPAACSAGGCASASAGFGLPGALPAAAVLHAQRGGLGSRFRRRQRARCGRRRAPLRSLLALLRGALAPDSPLPTSDPGRRGTALRRGRAQPDGARLSPRRVHPELIEGRAPQTGAWPSASRIGSCGTGPRRARTGSRGSRGWAWAPRS
jgi:hypothetical protein